MENVYFVYDDTDFRDVLTCCAIFLKLSYISIHSIFLGRIIFYILFHIFFSLLDPMFPSHQAKRKIHAIS